MLTAENATMRFGGLTAVSDLNITVGENEIVGLIGPNGAGKTTAFNMITRANDRKAADAACAILEKNKIRCWVAPRDIVPGAPFAEAIIDGINDSKVFVLLFSSNSNNSGQVVREVDRCHPSLSQRQPK